MVKRKRATASQDSDDDGNLPAASRRKTSMIVPPDEETLLDTQGYKLADIEKYCKVPGLAAGLLTYEQKRTLDWNPRTQGNLKYGFNVQAAITFVVGEPVNIPCYHCSKGSGAFTECVM